MFSKIFKQMLRHKFKTGIILLLIIGGGYFGYQRLAGNKNTVRYVTATVEKGTLIVSVSGSGQVAVSDQVDIKPKVSGEIAYVGVTNGQEVKTGALLAQIDSRNAQKTVRDAETALETAKLELEKLLQPADAYSLMQAENSLIQAKDNLTKLKFTQESDYQKGLEAKQKAEDNLEKTYEDAFNTIANAFLDLPTIITGLNDVLYSYEIGKSEPTVYSYQWNISALLNSVEYYDQYQLERFTNSAESNYKIAREKYDQNFENYKNASRYSDKEIIEDLLNETLETTKTIAETVKSETNMLDYWVDYRSQREAKIFAKVTEYQSNLKSYTSKTNSHLSSLLSIQRTIKDNKESKLNAERDLKEIDQNHPLNLAAAERSLKEKEESLANLKSGPDELDIRAKKISVQQKEDALVTAKQNLADHFVRAAFDGVVAKVNIKKGDSVLSGTTLATLITKQKIAEISLNEVDVAKIKVGQKTTITFDALPDVGISGKVIEVDIVGTTTQGVVSYGVKIAFDIEDEKIKPGMSVTADIITDVKQNTLVLPNGAIKSQGDSYYVELVEASEEVKQQLSSNASGITLLKPPKPQPVEIGLSNDLSTEIVSGLKEGDIVVASTISSSKVQTTQTQRFQMPGMGGR